MNTQTVDEGPDRDAWWTSIYHVGLLIAPAQLAEFFPATCPPLRDLLATRLRSQLARMSAGHDALGDLLDLVLEDILGLETAQWQKGSAVEATYSHRLVTGETLRPRRIWAPLHRGRLPVFVDTAESENLGRRFVARVVEWLRVAKLPFALLTNGRRWRLLHAGLEHESWADWDTTSWFMEGGAGPQLTALRILLGRDALRPDGDNEAPLLAAILASRKGQAELSAELGERVRQAVELLLQASSPVLDGHEPRALYIAATRLVMRCVVLLFAEARDLLPRDNPIYASAYSLNGLREQLDRAAGGRSERLRSTHSAWPRLMSLFRLVYFGSQHERLPVQRYGGGLFAPCYYDDEADRVVPLTDPIDRALEAIEHRRNLPSDAVVHAILELLTRSRVKVRQGRGSAWMMAPVNFSDLSSEYIGILYEGLLDFELRQAPADDAMVFLNLGSQPVLPLSRLDGMTEKEMGALVKNLRTTKKSDEADEDTPEEEAEVEEPEEIAPVSEDNIADLVDPDDTRRIVKERVQIWAEKAVKAAEIVKYRKPMNPRAREAFEVQARAAATSLYGKIVYPGGWYLVRWGGTRKGSGTFYTRPQLASPTTRRTLQPLLTKQGDDRGLLPAEILQIKVCDPAMGSGSFLISALRTLVDALARSLERHGRLRDEPTRTIIRLADGDEHTDPREETIPLPRSHPEFDARLRTRLARHVVEHCIYGVELDPLAVELARMALWIETMDRELPFEFLDHKLRCGNSLIGAWIDHVSDFPALCAEREAGDEKHEGHHFKSGVRSAMLKQYRSSRLKPGLRRLIAGLQQKEMYEPLALPELRATHAQALTSFQAIHALPMFDAEARAEQYAALRKDPAVARLRHALDRWCALWFWPTDRLDIAPGPLSPLTLDDATATEIICLRDHLHFFHWELEFPDVFTGPTSGFDAIVGNPPWETQKPNSMEFFANIDPLYRTYDKQQALRRQRELFKSDERIERQWLDYVGQFTAMSNWFHNVAWPFGDGKFTRQGEQLNLMESGGQWRKSDKLHQTWIDHRKERSSYSDPAHPYRYQGGADINTYKLFLEQSRALLRSDGPRGRLGLLVPSGIYTDKAAGDLRMLFLQHSSWTHLYALQNERFVFGDIDHRFKVAIVIAEKGGSTKEIATRFRIGPGDSPEAHEIEEDLLDDTRFLPLTISTIKKLSPNSGAILEIRDPRDLKILEKMYLDRVLLGDQDIDGWQIQYATEFHMTNDSRLFPPRAAWEAQGYQPNEYSHWVSAEGEVALALMQGAMLNQFDYSQKGWLSGTGLRARWEPITWAQKRISPQFLMARQAAMAASTGPYYKPVVRRIARNTDTRMTIACICPPIPCGDVASVLLPGSDALTCALVGILNSFIFDLLVRTRCGGTHVDYHYLAEMPLLPPTAVGLPSVGIMTLCLSGASNAFAPLWGRLVDAEEGAFSAVRAFPWGRLWAVTPHERLRVRCILDAVVAHLYGLTQEDFAWILRDCDHPTTLICNSKYARRFDPKGFWRVEKEQDPELRHPVLAQIAFHDLQAHDLDSFLAQNDGEGWMLPETLCLTDFGLGHDERARVAQPVAAALGPRFLPWQLEQSVEDSWEECRRHAEIIARIVPPPPPPLIAASVPAPDASAPPPVAGPGFPPVQAVLTGPPAPGQGHLFAVSPAPPSKPGKRDKKR